MRRCQSNMRARVTPLRSIALTLTAAGALGCPADPEPQTDDEGSTGSATGTLTSEGSSDDRGENSTGPGQVDTTSDADESTSDGGSDESSGSGGPLVECDNLPAIPVDATLLPTSTISEDFTFDGQGNMLGISPFTRALVATEYDGTATTILPDVSEFGRGIRVLPDGDYLAVDPGGGAVWRITPEGSRTTVITADDEPNGLAMHPNGMAYLTSGGGRVRRFDPDTGDVSLIAEGPSFDGITFNLDYSRLFYNTEGGEVFELPMDEDGLPTGEPSVFVTIPVDFILDGMTMDECDNLYIVEMAGVVWRVSPDGLAEVAIEMPTTMGGPAGMTFIAAINFGSGIGGWDPQRMYVMDLGIGVYEAELGVRGKPLPYALP